MIRHFESRELLEPEGGQRFQLKAALGCGLIAGVVLLLVPRGSPWAGVSFFSFVVMGRPVPSGVVLPLPAVAVLHLAIAELYGLVLSVFVLRATQGRAIVVGGLVGLGLYLLNLLVVTFALPAWRGNELPVLFTHLVFGLIAGGAYRGLLRRRAAA